MALAAVFVDRDGVLNEDRPEGVRRAEDFAWLPGALEALAELSRTLPVFVVTNQAGVGRGHVPRATVEAIHERLAGEVRGRGGELRGIYVCYHAPEHGCACRKPAPGLLRQAGREHGLDLSRVAFVGDDGRDLEAARRAGAIPILVLTGKGRATEARVRSGELVARGVFPDLAALARAVRAGDRSFEGRGAHEA